jgi:glycosyltransferase 2 family protein
MRYLINAAKALFAFALIYWLVSSGKLDLKAMRTLLKPQLFLASLLIIGVNLFLCSERWRRFLISQKLQSQSLLAFRLTLIGIFFNYVIPGGVGGDLVKGYYVAKNNPTEKAKAVVTVAMDRLVGLYAMLFLAIGVMVYDWQQVLNHPTLRLIFFLLIAITFAFSLFWALIFSRRISANKFFNETLGNLPYAEKLLKLYKSFTHYAVDKKVFFATFFLSLISQSVAILFFVFIGMNMGYDKVSLHTYFFVVPIGFMITAIPIAPAGVGVGQAAFYYLFELIDPASAPVGAIGITAQQIFYFLFGLIGAWFYITGAKRVSSLSQ